MAVFRFNVQEGLNVPHINDNFHKTTRQRGGKEDSLLLSMQMAIVMWLH